MVEIGLVICHNSIYTVLSCSPRSNHTYKPDRKEIHLIRRSRKMKRLHLESARQGDFEGRHFRHRRRHGQKQYEGYQTLSTEKNCCRFTRTY